MVSPFNKVAARDQHSLPNCWDVATRRYYHGSMFAMLTATIEEPQQAYHNPLKIHMQTNQCLRVAVGGLILTRS